MSRLVANRGYWKIVLLRVSELDVSDRTGCLLDLTGNSFVALATQADGPFYFLAFAHARVPCRRDLVEVIGEDVCRSAAIGPVHDQNVLIRKRDTRIQ